MLKLPHRIRRMVGLAVIRLIDDAKPYQRVQLDLGPKGPDGKPMQIRDDTPVMQHFGFTSHPPKGSDAAVIALGGDANQLVVVATGHRQYRITGLPEGGMAIHSTDGNYVKLLPDGTIESAGALWTHEGPHVLNGNLTVDAPSSVDLTAPANVLVDTPAVSATGNVAVGSGATGSFTTPTGNVVTVQSGIVINIM